MEEFLDRTLIAFQPGQHCGILLMVEGDGRIGLYFSRTFHFYPVLVLFTFGSDSFGFEIIIDSHAGHEEYLHINHKQSILP